MFRFSQKLSHILDVSQVVQGQLDQYDIELEDAISNFTTSTSGGGSSTDTWTFTAGDLHPTTTPTTFTAPTTTGDATVTANGGGSAIISATSFGDAKLLTDTGWTYVGSEQANVRIYTNGTGPIQIFSGADISLQIGSGANLLMLGLPTSAPATTGAVWRDPITNILKIVP